MNTKMAILMVGAMLGLVYADLDDTLYVDGMAVDGLGLYKDKPLEGFTSLEHSPGRLPEFSLTKPLFAARDIDPEERAAYFQAFQQQILATKVESGDWFIAMELVENQLAYKPGDLESLHRAASLAAVMKDYEKAEAYFREYLKERPQDLLMRSGWAHVLLHLGRLTEAENVCKSILKVNPESLEGHFTILCTYLARNLEPEQPKTPDGQDYWLFRSLPEKRMTANWLSQDREELTRLLGDEGLQRLSSQTLGPGTDENLTLIYDALNKSELAYLERRWGDALVFYDLAKKYGVTSVHMYQNMSRCYMEMGDPRAALGIMRTLVQTAPDVAQIWSNVGYILMQSGMYVEASKSFRQALKLEPNNQGTRFSLAAAYAGAGQLDQAWPILESLSKNYPEELTKWLDGDKPYLVAIQKDRRFPLLF